MRLLQPAQDAFVEKEPWSLTQRIYIHVEFHDQTTAITSLPPPPGLANKATPEAAELRRQDSNL